MALKLFKLNLNEALFADVGKIADEAGLSPAAFVELCILKTLEAKQYANYDRQTLDQARQSYHIRQKDFAKLR